MGSGGLSVAGRSRAGLAIAGLGAAGFCVRGSSVGGSCVRGFSTAGLGKAGMAAHGLDGARFDRVDPLAARRGLILACVILGGRSTAPLSAARWRAGALLRIGVRTGVGA